jgi:2-polyprenyl-3-methyl-5-hydroxy-6-metoxy-1,4-benzoquinol methylase
MSSTSWDNFWKDQRQSFYAVMKMATGFFVSKIQKVYQLKATDDIFDYGCGPGFVADSLAPENIRITGADINEFFIDECRKNHPGSLFMVITTDVAVNRKILGEQLKEKRFDYILLLSVAQYLKSVNDLEDIIKLLQTYLKAGGRIIVADVLDENTSSVRDAFSLFIHCIKKGRIGAFVGFISYLLFSDYRQISKKNKLLHVPEPAMFDIARRNQLHCEKVNNLTLQTSRSNYVLSHSPVKSSV